MLMKKYILSTCLLMNLYGGASMANVITVDMNNHAEESVVTGPDATSSTYQGRVYTDSSDLELTSDADYNGIEQLVGLLFDNVGIAAGSTINSAFIAFTIDDIADDTPAKQAGHDATGDITIQIEDSADAAAYQASDFNVSNRTTTVDSIIWTSTPGLFVGEIINTADLTLLVDSMVNGGEWTGNNSMNFLFSSPGQNITREVESAGTGAPRLNIDFTPVATTVTEPSSIAILTVSLAGLGFLRRRRTHQVYTQFTSR
ncbi:MAG: hypothetical protein ACI95X_002488 [Paraglaciecola sp.]|jgi:hypothetical protein